MDDEGVVSYKKCLIQAFNSQYSKLFNTLENSLEALSKEMFEAGLITRTVMLSNDYDKMVGEFLATMAFKTTIPQLQQHCRSFTNCLERLGGAAKLPCENLIKVWHLEATPDEPQHTVQEKVLKTHSVQLCELLKVEETCQSLTNNLISSGLLSADVERSPNILLQEMEALLHHSPYRFTDVLAEMRKVESLQEMVTKLERYFMSYISKLLDTTSTGTDQQQLSMIVSDNEKLMTFLGEAEGKVINSYILLYVYRKSG